MGVKPRSDDCATYRSAPVVRAPGTQGCGRAALDRLRALGEGVAETLWPTRCVGCDSPGSLLCDECASLLPAIDQRLACPRCGAPFGSLVCTECTDCLCDREGPWTERVPGADAVACFGVHRWPLDRLVRAYKDWGELRLAGILAKMIVATAVRADDVGNIDLSVADAVAFVPATPRAFARRGADHMEPVAARAASLLGLPLVDAVARCDARDQRGLGKEGRAANAAGTFVALAGVRRRRLLLLDDVVTTGATLDEAARACKAAGAISVWGLAAARAW